MVLTTSTENLHLKIFDSVLNTTIKYLTEALTTAATSIFIM